MNKIVLVLVLLSVPFCPAGADFHVAVTGSDAAPGTEAAPFHSLVMARDAIRGLRQASGLPEGGVTVWVHKGAYQLAESFTLGEEDGGAPGSPVAYRAFADEEVRLLGGRALPSDGFTPVTDETASARIDPSARASVKCLSLKALGITEYGAFPDAFGGAIAVTELFVDDERMTLARWPNEDWATIARVVESGVPPGVKWNADKPGIFEYDGDRPSRWVGAPGVWLHGYWCFDWRSETIKVANIDTAKRQIALLKRHHYGIGGGNPAPRRYYALNLLEELDQPGEYYLDRDSGLLYFWPPKALEEARVVLSTLASPAMLLEGASHVTLRGLTVEACAGTGIRVVGGRGNLVAGCHVRNTGMAGIIVDGGEAHRVAGCDIHDTGTAGLRMSGGDRPTLTPSGHEITNNHIHHVSRRQRTGAYHIHIGGVGVRVAHNLIHDGPHQAIGLGGNDHIIELNEIHHTGMETDDCGAFYMGRNPSERGSVLRYNFWHDIGSSFTHGSCAVYFDDGAGGQTVFGNVFYRAAGGSFGAVFSHGGHDNMVDNNIFVECSLALGQAPWNDAHWREQLKGKDWQTKLLEQVDITKPPYSDRYPQLKGFMTPSDEPRLNQAYRNVVVDCDALVTGNWVLLDNWILDEDPGFLDASALNFKLKEGSAVFGRVPGFKPIPFEKIGLSKDEYRSELPQM
jgi:Right handed beta helix region